MTETATIAPLDTEAAHLLLARVRQLVAGVPRSRRPLLAVVITPEDGVRLMPRGELSARLREAGLDHEARMALHLAKGDADALLAWGEAEGEDGAEAGLHVLRFAKPRRRAS